SYDTLLFETRDAVAFITINRPDKLNALNDQVVDELSHAAERVATEDGIKGAILTGAGSKAFVAGADIGDLAKQGPFDGKARALRIVGKGNALYLILTAEMIDAQEALRIGLVNKIVPAGELLAGTEKVLRGILSMGPLAVRLALEVVDQGLEMTLEEGLLLEADHFGLLAATQDMK